MDPVEWNRCFIAVGSNIGERLTYIEDACSRLDALESVRVIRTSGLWETKPMYVEDQDTFLNGVIEIRTKLQPIDLLNTLQKIEQDIGRVKLINKGPRSIDLDILLYNDLQFDHPRLSIPHALMLERGFVLKPLCELIPNEHSPVSHNTFQHHLRQMKADDLPVSTSVQVCETMESLKPGLPQRSTMIMSVLNVTPDSFSDGGEHSADDKAHLRKTIEGQIQAGARIIDVGGQSSRPHAAPITAAEEISRVVPCVRLIREVISDKQLGNRVAISIDTYRSEVAEAAVQAGAHIVNDISGGQLDARMLSTVARLGCAMVVMHMRGDPRTMTSKANTSYTDGVVEGVGGELVERIAAAEQAGIRRWRIILDPGIGFAKTGEQNAHLLRSMGLLRTFPGLENMPWLVGTSRKGFVGKITGVENAKDRTWGTAAAVTAAIAGGADIVRVHDVAEMRQVAAMSDAIWRRPAQR